MEADGAVDAQNAPTAPWKTLCVFHELPQGLSHQVTHEKLRKAPKYRWETRIDPVYRGPHSGRAAESVCSCAVVARMPDRDLHEQFLEQQRVQPDQRARCCCVGVRVGVRVNSWCLSEIIR